MPARCVHFPTGTALVDASSLGGLNLATLAEGRETPVYGLSGYPKAHYQLPTPKIALYAGSSVPSLEA